MHAFDYHRPASLEEAEQALAAGGQLLAGGQTLLPVMKLRLAGPPAIVDLAAVPGLDAITEENGTLSIGAMATHAAVAESAAVKQAIPGLAELAEGIGDPQVRNRGTLGGSVANNDPAADYPAAVLALNATVHTNRRAIEADDFFTELFTTALEEDEILTAVGFPVPRRFAYAKMVNRASRYALVGVAVAETEVGVRLAVTGAGASGVFRVPEMEAALGETFAPAAIEGIAVDPANLMSDLHADAEYRAHLVGVMARRAVAAAGGG